MIIAVNRLYWFPARWQFIYYAVVKVAVSSHGKCSWDWSSGHHQHMRRNHSLGPKLCTLSHSKPMLFISYSQTQVFEFNRIFNYSMSPYQKFNGTLFQFL